VGGGGGGGGGLAEGVRAHPRGGVTGLGPAFASVRLAVWSPLKRQQICVSPPSNVCEGMERVCGLQVFLGRLGGGRPPQPQQAPGGENSADRQNHEARESEIPRCSHHAPHRYTIFSGGDSREFCRPNSE